MSGEARMTDMPTAKPESAIDRDLPCVRCGYNLRTLALDGLCPECGTRVALTITLGAELANSRPGYVARLAVACRLLFLSRMLGFAALMLVIVGQSDTLGLLAAAALTGMTILYAAGTWLLAAREHPELPPELKWSVCCLKLLSIALIVGTVLFWLGIWSTPRPFWLPNMPWGLRQFVHLVGPDTLLYMGWAALAAFLISPIPETRMMVRLARRLADAWLGEHALIAGVGATVSGLATLILPWALGNIAGWGGLFIPLIVLTGVLLFWLWLAACSLIAARGFSRAARGALARWRRESPST